VTGYSYAADGYADYATIKYDASGNQLWVRRYHGPGIDNDAATAIAVDGQDSVYVTGNSTGANGKTDYATIKYDAGGSQKWVRRYDGPASGYDEAKAIAVDSQDNVIVTGSSDAANSTPDYLTIKYDTA